MSQVADEATAEAVAKTKEEKDNEQFRRYSMELGFETDVVPKRKVKATAATDAEMKQYVLDYIEFIKTAKNINVMASDYYKENFERLEDPELELAEMKRFLELFTIKVVSICFTSFLNLIIVFLFLLNKCIPKQWKLTNYSSPRNLIFFNLRNRC